MTILSEDRRIAGVWIDEGQVPVDQGARTYAALVCARFLAAYDDLAGSLDTLIAKADAYDRLTAPIPGQLDVFGGEAS